MAATDINQQLIDQLLHQFKYSENILKLLGVLGDALQDTFDAADFILSHVSLDDYAGEQLNFWGELIGVGRPLAQEPQANLFTLRHLGYTGDPDNKTGFKNTDDPAVTTGGYLVSHDGLASISDPGALMTDADYRYLIRQKSASYRSKMTHLNLFNYLLAFGSRCKIDDTTDLENEFEPQNWNDLNHWQKNYVETKGFKPGGISVDFPGALETIKDI